MKLTSIILVVSFGLVVVDFGAEALKNSCTFDVDEGKCNAKLRRYYYDQTSGSCKPFFYGGCEGNANRFKSRHLCKRICEDRCIANCTIESSPVCGTDGKTYQNECLLTCKASRQPSDNLGKDYEGECQQEGACANVDCPPFDPPANTTCSSVQEEGACCPTYNCVPIGAPNSDCIDKEGQTVADGEIFRPANSCVDCICQGGKKVCPVIEDCLPMPGPRCTKIHEEDACCPTYDCEPPVLMIDCIDQDGNILADGETFRPADSCVDCTCHGGRKVCPEVDCPPFPGPHCTEKLVEGACCPLYDCERSDDNDIETDETDVPSENP